MARARQAQLNLTVRVQVRDLTCSLRVPSPPLPSLLFPFPPSPLVFGVRRLKNLLGSSVRSAFVALHFLSLLGMQKRKVSSLCTSLSRVVARCSYAIYLSRENKDWDRNRELLAEADVPCQTVQDKTAT